MKEYCRWWQTRIDELKNLRDMQRSHLRHCKAAVTKCQKYQADVRESITLAQGICQTIQQKAHKKITAVVNACLQSVFYDEDYGFRLRIERKRNKTEVYPTITNRGHDVIDPIEAEGGGVLDVAAFVLQLACLMTKKPLLRRILIVDEPFKFVSAEYRDNVRDMIEMLQAEFDVQIIMVTHMDELTTGTVVNI